MSIKDTILQFVSEKIKLIIAMFFSMLTVTVLKVVTVTVFADLIYEIFTKNNFDALPIRLTIIIVSMLIIFSVSLLKEKQVSNLGTYVSSNLSIKAYKSLLTAEINELEKEEVKLATKNVIDNSKAIGELYITKNLLSVIEKLLFILVSVIGLMIIKPAFSLIVLAGLPFIFVIEKGLEKLLAHFDAKRKLAENENRETFNKNIARIENIKLLNSIEYETEKYSDVSSKNAMAINSTSVSSRLVNSAFEELFVGIIAVIVIGVGCWIAGNEDLGITSKVIIVFSTLIPTIYANFRKVTKLRITPNFIMDKIEELQVILNLRSEFKSEPVNTLDEIHTFNFSEVTYVNGKKKKIFENISFDLKRGEKIGILSTDKKFKDGIFDCITKTGKIKSGEISINNCEINKINTGYLRDVITSINEESSVTAGTIIQNVSYPYKLDLYKFNDALYKSGLKDTISEFPLKENTIVDETLDKDILDRLIFANAFYKDSKIYLINDATKNYSVTTEAALLNEVFKLKNKIVIMLTDKVYNLVGCDKVLIYENGEVIEYGKYSELLQNKTSYLYKVMRKGSTITKSTSKKAV